MPLTQAVHPTFWLKVKEFLICFISSLYPSWDLNLYIEDHPVAQPEIGVNNAEQAIVEGAQEA